MAELSLLASTPADSSRIVSGALAYLALHLEGACPRSAYLATLLLNRIACDPAYDSELRRQSRLLAELIDMGEDSRALLRRPCASDGTSAQHIHPAR